MEHIRQAVELAKARNATAPSPPASREARAYHHQSNREAVRPGERDRKVAERKDGECKDGIVVALDPERLESKRVIAHNVLDQRSRAYDMLRTQVLRAMAAENWQLIGVTSPTAGCGKTLTAVNLAMSISRQPFNFALLIDLDLQRPQVAKTLGLNTDKGLIAVLEGEIAKSRACWSKRRDPSCLGAPL